MTAEATTLSDVIGRRYRAAVEDGDVPALVALYRSDALLDAHVPGWRFQVRGPEAIAERTVVMPRPGRFTDFDARTTEDGLLVRFQWQQDHDHGGAAVRQLHAFRATSDGIEEQVLFCAGVWSRQLQERIAAEAPLVRP